MDWEGRISSCQSDQVESRNEGERERINNNKRVRKRKGVIRKKKSKKGRT